MQQSKDAAGGSAETIEAREQARETLRLAGAAGETEFDLAEVALAFAVIGYPEAPLERYREHLAQLAEQVGHVPIDEHEGIGARAEALRTVLAESFGYEGDVADYDDLQNANLIRVIDRRRGLPVALGILYVVVARLQGWTAAGLNFPSHFLVRLDHRGERAILDPFNRGRLLSTADLHRLLRAGSGAAAPLLPEYYAPASDRTMLIRLQNNIKLRLLQAGELRVADEVLGDMLLLAPGEAVLWEEAGLLASRLEQPGRAIACFERVIALSADETQSRKAAERARRLRAFLN